MSFLTRLEGKLRRFAVPHVTLGLIFCQVLTYVAIQTQVGEDGASPLEQRLLLIPQLVLAGEVWRLVTFLVVPPIGNPIFAFFFWYLFYLMGTALECQWGEFRYNLYLLIGYLGTVAASFLTPDLPSSNGYLQASVFLAFAYLYPHFEIHLFFLLPVKIKWLALLTWIGYFITAVFGDWLSRLLILASVGNFFCVLRQGHLTPGANRQAAHVCASGPSGSQGAGIQASLYHLRHHRSNPSPHGLSLLQQMRRRLRLLHRAPSQPRTCDADRHCFWMKREKDHVPRDEHNRV